MWDLTFDPRASTIQHIMVGGSNSPVTDAAGVVWQTRNIVESAATVSYPILGYGPEPALRWAGEFV